MRRLIAWVVVAGTLTLPVACSDDGPDSADSFTEVVTLHGQDGAVWELGVQGFVVGSSAVNNRVNGPCVSVLASLHLVDGPGLGAAFGPSVAAAGLTVAEVLDLLHATGREPPGLSEVAGSNGLLTRIDHIRACMSRAPDNLEVLDL